MADPMTGAEPRCPWCSAVLPSAGLARCPSCGATLIGTGDAEADIRGVTTLDPEAILRARSDGDRPRGRLLSFITGEVPVEAGDPGEAESLAPPDDAVRREMLRLEIEAERADLEAETIALKTDAVLDLGINLADLPGEPVPAEAESATSEPMASPAAAPDAAAQVSTPGSPVLASTPEETATSTPATGATPPPAPPR